MFDISKWANTGWGGVDWGDILRHMATYFTNNVNITGKIWFCPLYSTNYKHIGRRHYINKDSI